MYRRGSSWSDHREKSVKRIFKGPWLWIVLSAFAVLLAIQFLAPSDGYDEVETSRRSEYIAAGEVKEITFVDGDQEIRATLDDGLTDTSTIESSGTVRPSGARTLNADRSSAANCSAPRSRTRRAVTLPCGQPAAASSRASDAPALSSCARSIAERMRSISRQPVRYEAACVGHAQ